MALVSRYVFLILFASSLWMQAVSQESKSVDFWLSIKKYDLSVIWMADKINTHDGEGGSEILKRTEALGFIGDDYQRFLIHFSLVAQSPTDRYEYRVVGKTKVKELVRSFQGTIKVKQAKLYTHCSLAGYKQGFVICDVALYEDQKLSATGKITGVLKSNYVIDKKGRLTYDAIDFVADGFSNNQFVGSWTSYKTQLAKKCHWGDYRIPECGNLDIGAAEFSVNDQFVSHGWQSYRLAYFDVSDSLLSKKAQQKEKTQWWR